MIEGFEPRLYQQTILNTTIEKNTLVVLPTGLGKTVIAMMLAAHRLKEIPDSKIVFLAPTKPLVQQHKRTFVKHLDTDEETMHVFTGDIRPDKREKLWQDAKIVFSTPQGFENDVISSRVNLEDVSLMVFDEAHRATGEYSYVFIAEKYMTQAHNPRVLGLTASPGSDQQKIRNVCDNLYIDEIELRTDEDPDVKPYIQDVDIERITIDLPDDFAQVIKYLRDCMQNKLEKIKDYGYLTGSVSNYSRKDLLKLQKGMQSKMAQGEKDWELMKSLSLNAEAMKVQHALILAETQGMESLVNYMRRLQKEAKNSQTKAVQNLVKDKYFRSAKAKAESLIEQGVEHPKMKRLKKIVASELNQNRDARIIIFNQYRDQVEKLKKEFDDIGFACEMFVGQMKKGNTGMSQKEQKQTIERFEDGEFNILLATSVAEEGLDIPAVDLVVFYEPIPSAVRTVQRRGRTGRQEQGKVKVLITKDTVDEGYRWSAHHKEKNMIEAIKNLQDEFNPEHEKPTLDEYVEEDQVTIYADYREKGGGVIKELSRENVDVQMKSMDVGDYLLSEDLCVEFKTVQDFADSVVDGRLLEQMKDLSQYKKPLMVIEGEEDIYAMRKMHPNAIRGMLATIMFNYNIPVFQTKDAHETAGFLKLLAKREQEDKDTDWQFHTNKPLTLKERQEYVVAAMPGIGNKLAKPLLEEFGSIKNLVNATEEELKNVDLIGDKKAEQLRELFDTGYDDQG